MRVFISYSHDSEAHRKRVLELANRLRRDGIEAWIDRYTPAPAEGWIRWMQAQMQQADFVILVCTEEYRRRFDGATEGSGGRGVAFEGWLASQILYEAKMTNNKFVPLLFDGEPEESIPLLLRGYASHLYPSQYEDLYGRLTGQPEITPPALGPVRARTPVVPLTIPDAISDGVRSGSLNRKPETPRRVLSLRLWISSLALLAGLSLAVFLIREWLPSGEGSLDSSQQTSVMEPPVQPEIVVPAALTSSSREIRIDDSNLEEYAENPWIEARKLILDGVTLTAPANAVYMADEIEMGNDASITGEKLAVIAGSISGGSLRANGREGMEEEAGGDGGEMLLVVGNIHGTRLLARGGKGGVGKRGDDGPAGSPGRDGENGVCGPGTLGQFHGSTAGENGGAGQDGGPGGLGGEGGKGGEIVILTWTTLSPVAEVQGGPGGEGGEGGRGGRGGSGGRGGAGCVGLGGTQPTRANGNPGLDGRQGHSGARGKPGEDGTLAVKKVNLETIKEALASRKGESLLKRLNELGGST